MTARLLAFEELANPGAGSPSAIAGVYRFASFRDSPEKPKEPSMTKTVTILAGALGLSLLAAPAQAQLARTFVSSFGSDFNNCDRATPCRTFQHAHDQTLANGEITVLDAGGYGAVNINRTISIINDGVGEAGMLISGGAIGASIVGTDINVSLRGLTIKGIGFGSGNGIDFVIGKSLILENCTIRNLTNDVPGVGTAIRVRPGGALVSSHIVLSNTLISDSFVGLDIIPTGSGVVRVALNRAEFYNNTSAINVAPGSTTVSAQVSAAFSVVDGSNAIGVNVSTLAGSSHLTTVTFIQSLLTNNGTALVSQGSVNSQLRIGASLVAGNTTAWQVATGGIFQSFQDNYIVGNDNQPTPPIANKE
jgi:hypothetical protein